MMYLCRQALADPTSAAPMIVAATKTVGGPVDSGIKPEETASAPVESVSDAAEDAGVWTSAQRIDTDVNALVTVHAARQLLRVSEMQRVYLRA
ncbi:hypothetical protein GN244_ATG07106 [Phytophthora infestans]|uniref:Uncharacterized protein n=2 Tax=Phytophthora infestans TaxID=4787 RepID=A0A833TBN6_PHYIN|nr:hypothetical protein GN244_ATG07106 [Phytophthora infestans]